MMKRYWVFAGDNYYPSGGMHDHRGSYDTVVEAVSNIGRCDWWHVLDSKTMQCYNQNGEQGRMSGPALLEWAAEIDKGN